MGMKIDVGISRVFENRVLKRIVGLKREGGSNSRLGTIA
jgi:hypothetical protein